MREKSLLYKSFLVNLSVGRAGNSDNPSRFSSRELTSVEYSASRFTSGPLLTKSRQELKNLGQLVVKMARAKFTAPSLSQKVQQSQLSVVFYRHITIASNLLSAGARSFGKQTIS